MNRINTRVRIPMPVEPSRPTPAQPLQWSNPTFARALDTSLHWASRGHETTMHRAVLRYAQRLGVCDAGN